MLLTFGSATATIHEHGAEPVRWTVAGRDLLWHRDARFWDRVSPILFPIVGWARDGMIHVDGQAYAMGVHGFAAGETFEVVGRAEDSVTLALRDTPQLRARFPFSFRLEVTYTLEAASLRVDFVVTNAGDRDLPYALGLHPGFAWPFAGGQRDDYVIEFAEEERASVPRITDGGLFAADHRTIPFTGRRLALNDALFANEAICFLDGRSKAVRFIAPDGTAIELATEEFPHLALWSRPGAPFICIEAWTGHGDPEGFSGDIREKPSMRLLAPGDAAKHAVTMCCAGP
ncbi:aldose 1-epimerase family protein [Variibacter gotjawalensis]|uniref:aldose 1-epimerase family protein n=1 Tax=Variibacter gotjawalensis TaxID=1333996 RepID=UPI0024BFA900|nr:aldose 1-epimerase family protein [Variibacter gotjawalensis]